MARMPIPRRLAAITPKPCGQGALRGSNPPLGGLPPGTGQVAYALLTHPPLSRGRSPDPVRLACVKPAASVHPEPGSNSSSLNSFISSNRFVCCRANCYLPLLVWAYAICPYELTSGFTRFFKSFLCCTTLCQGTCCFSTPEALPSSFAGAKV